MGQMNAGFQYSGLVQIAQMTHLPLAQPTFQALQVNNLVHTGMDF